MCVSTNYVQTGLCCWVLPCCKGLGAGVAAEALEPWGQAAGTDQTPLCPSGGWWEGQPEDLGLVWFKGKQIRNRMRQLLWPGKETPGMHLVTGAAGQGVAVVCKVKTRSQVWQGAILFFILIPLPYELSWVCLLCPWRLRPSKLRWLSAQWNQNIWTPKKTPNQTQNFFCGVKMNV